MNNKNAQEYTPAFETLWREKRLDLLKANAEYKQAMESFKMQSGADWLLFGLPVAGAVVVLEWGWFDNEMLNWVLSAAVAIVLFVVATLIKNRMSGTRLPGEIEADVKKAFFEEWCKENALHKH